MTEVIGSIAGGLIGGSQEGASPTTYDVGREPWAGELAQTLYDMYIEELGQPLDYAALTPEEEQTLINREMENLGYQEQEAMRQATERAGLGGYLTSPQAEKLFQPLQTEFAEEKSQSRQDISLASALERKEAEYEAEQDLWEKGTGLYNLGKGTYGSYTPTTYAEEGEEVGSDLSSALSDWWKKRKGTTTPSTSSTSLVGTDLSKYGY